MKSRRIYLGLTVGHQHWDLGEVFRCPFTPTEATHGDRFVACIGPFRTARAANLMRTNGRGNPHLQTVGQAERMARKLASEKQSCRSK